jgi:hypothetical protein
MGSPDWIFHILMAPACAADGPVGAGQVGPGREGVGVVGAQNALAVCLNKNSYYQTAPLIWLSHESSRHVDTHILQ